MFVYNFELVYSKEHVKIIETHPREVGFVLWGHCQNLLDDPRILNKVKESDPSLLLHE